MGKVSFAKLKGIFDTVETGSKVLGFAGFAVSVVVPSVVTTSATLRWFIIGFGVIGAVLGYLFTALSAEGWDQNKCIRRRRIFFGTCWIPLFLALLIIESLKPGVARQFSFVDPIRECLIQVIVLTDFGVGIMTGLALYLFVGAITLNSSKLCKQRDLRGGP